MDSNCYPGLAHVLVHKKENCRRHKHIKRKPMHKCTQRFPRSQCRHTTETLSTRESSKVTGSPPLQAEEFPAVQRCLLIFPRGAPGEGQLLLDLKVVLPESLTKSGESWGKVVVLGHPDVNQVTEPCTWLCHPCCHEKVCYKSREGFITRVTPATSSVL